VSIGQLKLQVTIQQPVKTSDGMMGFTETWGDVATVWAAILPVSAHRRVEAKQSGINMTHDVTIRYRAGVLPSYRIKYHDLAGDDRYFSISGIVDQREAHKYLLITCAEGDQ
jgi:SPP1 family predicted phage head-tail adaptor